MDRGLSSPLHSFVLQPHSLTLVSDASGDAIGGYCLETGAWWRFDLNADERARVQNNVHTLNDLSINVLELLGMLVTAYLAVVCGSMRPPYRETTVLVKGYNMSAVHWVNKRRGGKEPRSGARMRFLGVVEMSSE